jgi:hypothetical protein
MEVQLWREELPTAYTGGPVIKKLGLPTLNDDYWRDKDS